MNKTERKELRDLSESEFMKAWTNRAKELDKAKEDCRAFREEYDRRLVAEKVEAMPEAERAAIAQYVRAEGIETEETVNNG